MLPHRKHRNEELLRRISLLVVMNQEFQRLFHVINRLMHEAKNNLIKQKNLQLRKSVHTGLENSILVVLGVNGVLNDVPGCGC